MTTDPKTNDYATTLELGIEPEKTIALFTSPEGVSQWWGPTTGNATIDGTLTTGFGDYGSNSVKVDKVTANEVVWSPTTPEGTKATGHVQEWIGTQIEIEVDATENGSRLRFRHRGLTPELNCWNDCEAGWNQFMDSIRSYAETGTGKPFQA